MSKPSKKVSIRMPTPEEDHQITQAALNDPDALPLTDEQMNRMVPLKTIRGRPSSLFPSDIALKCLSISGHPALAGNHGWMRC
jgi:hypothetical protein